MGLAQWESQYSQYSASKFIVTEAFPQLWQRKASDLSIEFFQDENSWKKISESERIKGYMKRVEINGVISDITVSEKFEEGKVSQRD